MDEIGTYHYNVDLFLTATNWTVKSVSATENGPFFYSLFTRQSGASMVLYSLGEKGNSDD